VNSKDTYYRRVIQLFSPFATKMRLPKEPVNQRKVFIFLWIYFMCIFLSMKDFGFDLVYIRSCRL